MVNVLGPAILAALALLLGATTPATRITAENCATRPKAPRDGPVAADRCELADDLDLLATCVSAGLPLAAATAAVAGAAGESTAAGWSHIATLLSLGTDADQAFDVASHPGFEDVARHVRRSLHSGTALASGCHDLAKRLRAQAEDDATARAERVGVLIALPLTLCFLPAFLLLGLAPMILSLGTDLFTP
ncbi:type II secretion system F family protein [Corynebacterium uterequi]|uniref:Type II secretion system protein F n=1 Tax=Corynebacterium uterequi TaxID=1072256 RepID=A0A0G3HA20_9CORY|nr:type II secretion system F family protein [Corynebacterium uterequi]AKK10201.1 type II secretion system protein F [Corynebacterium uterequi]